MISKDDNPNLLMLTGTDNSITITISSDNNGIGIILNLGASLAWIIKCASRDSLTEAAIQGLKDGLVII